MTTVTEAAMAASVILGLVSIPAVSQTATTPDNLQTSTPDISDTESVPKKVSSTTSSQSFQASIGTAFDRFKTHITQNNANATLETPHSSLEMSKSPDRVAWNFSTSEGELYLLKTSEKVVEMAETPDGTLKVVKQNGNVKREFKGSNRNSVVKAKKELEKALEKRRQRIDQKRKQVRQQTLPNLEIIANDSVRSGFGDNTNEHVVIVNNQLENVSLKGWKIQNDRPYSYEFGDVEIRPGERFRIYTNGKDEVEFDGEAVYDTGLIWRDSGDTATLFNDEGIEIAEKAY